jgi:phosphatidylserine/phosphatidylglycerophosphate/cardiolipin synthase-like enzyme
VIENATLAARFRNHILADFAQAERLGGTPEAVEPETLVDVPMATLEAIELEAPAAQVLEPLTVKRRVRVRPLLTPDRQGAVFSEAVLELIGSAKSQLVLQNQYIKIRHDSSGFIEQLVEALIERSKRIEDLRIILRSENQGFLDDASELKRRGLDVERCVRLLPKTHTKGIVVDGRRVLVGSHNWSWAGVTLNRDASLLFEDEEITRYYLRAFELDWDRARELGGRVASAGEVPRLAVGDRPPPGFVRMSLHDYLEG